MSMINNKNAVSAVVATVLLILITVAAVAIVAGVIVPFVIDHLDNAKKCYEATDQLTIETGKFTCYNSGTPKNTSVMIRRGVNSKFEMKGILLAPRDNTGSSKVYKIYDNTETPDVFMYDHSTTLKIPGVGGAETYILPISSDYVSIAPILPSGGTCKEISEDIGACAS